MKKHFFSCIVILLLIITACDTSKQQIDLDENQTIENTNQEESDYQTEIEDVANDTAGISVGTTENLKEQTELKKVINHETVEQGDSASFANTDPQEELPNEESYKASCREMTYQSLNKIPDDSWDAYDTTYKYSNIHSRLVICNKEDDGTYLALEEDEALKDYGIRYEWFSLIDNRAEKGFDLISGIVVDVYGNVTDVKYNMRNGRYYPIISVKYVDYVRLLSDKDGEVTDIYEEIERRDEAERKRIEMVENWNSTYSDYTGTTKNAPNMEELSETEFKECCDEMNAHDMNNEENHVLDTYIKVHLNVKERKKFIIKEEKYLGKYYIKDTFIVAGMYNERTEKYEGIHDIYFSENCKIEGKDLKNGQEIVVYGKVVDCSYISTGNMFDMVVWYVE